MKPSIIADQDMNTFDLKQQFKRFTAIPLYRNAVYLIVDNAVSALGGFFFWVIVARFYTETEVGYGSAIVSAINLLSLLGLVGLNFAIIRFLSQDDKPRELINSSFTLSGLITLAAAAVFIAGLGFWSPVLMFIRKNAIFAIAFMGVALLSTLANLTDSVFVARRKASYVLLHSTIFSLLKIPLPLAFVFFLHTFGVIASWGIALGIALAIALFLFMPKVEDHYRPVPTLSIGHIKSMSKYAGNSYIVSVLAMAPSMVLPIMVVNLLGTATNAYFYMAWMMAGLLSAIPMAVSQSLFAEGSHAEHSMKNNVIRSIKFNYLLLVPALIVLALAGKWLLLAFGKSYSENALTLLWLLSLSCLPMGVTSVYTSLLRVRDRLTELALIRGFLTATVLAVCFILMPKYGIVIGVGCVWLGAQLIVAIYSTLRLSSWIRQTDHT